jgi:hypothetical protein
LEVVGGIFGSLPQVEWLTTMYPLIWNERGCATVCVRQDQLTREGFFRGLAIPTPYGDPYPRETIQQESTFWRRSLWESAGGCVDASLHLAGDFDLWARFYENADLYGVGTPLGGYRAHEDQKTASRFQDYIEEAREVLARYKGDYRAKTDASRLSAFLSWSSARVDNALRVGRRSARTKRCVYTGRNGGWVSS